MDVTCFRLGLNGETFVRYPTDIWKFKWSNPIIIKFLFSSTLACNMLGTFHLHLYFIFSRVLHFIKFFYYHCKVLIVGIHFRYFKEILIKIQLFPINVFHQHIKTRFVRILSQTWKVQMAMRVKLYGCSHV